MSAQQVGFLTAGQDISRCGGFLTLFSLLGNFCLSLEYVGLSPLSRFLAWKMPVMDNISNVSVSAMFVSSWMVSGFWVVCVLVSLFLGWSALGRLLVPGTHLWCQCKGSSPLPLGCLDCQMRKC